MKTHELICIVCPVGCKLKVVIDEEKNEIKVLGARCKRGVEYGKKEVTNPERLFFGIVAIRNGIVPVLPVRTSAPIPKAKIKEATAELKKIEVPAPVKVGEVIVKNFMNLGVDLLAARNVDKK